jgi:3-methylfumaryl-CoA hydratase
MSVIDLQPYQSWLERRDTVTETLAPIPALALAATLDLPEAPAESLPPLWHWLHFLDRVPSSQLGPDGSPSRRSLLPPIPLPEVMWAGAETEFVRPLRIGEPAVKTSRLADMVAKTGARGPMVFLTQEHRFEQGGEVALIERTRAVVLGAQTTKPAAAPPEDPPGERSRAWLVDESVLFRFSALTFNSHRIHYDLRYTTEVGGYPGLVVHGPLQAMLLAETFRHWHPQARVTRIAFRAQAPHYCSGKVEVRGAARGERQYALWTRPPAGGTAMSCVIDWLPGSA